MPEHETPGSGLRGEYQHRMLEIRAAFYAGATGAETIAARSQAMDQLIRGLWEEAEQRTPGLRSGIVLLALGGYGRSELFPYSDVDLLYLLDGKVSEQEVKQPIRRVSQELWDVGIRLSPITRKRSEVEKFEPDNVESTLALLDHRLLAGDASVYERFSGTGLPQLLQEKGSAIATGLVPLLGRPLLAGDASVYERFSGTGLPRLLEEKGSAIATGLVTLTAERHKKYGDTLFHLEPSIKDCPGGLRDVHVCGWLTKLAAAAKAGSADGAKSAATAAGDNEEFRQAVGFLSTVRCFLHYRHERDDNTLDWQAQDAAAREHERRSTARDGEADAAYWMRLYFRHARAVERCLIHMLEALPAKQKPGRWTVGKAGFFKGRRRPQPPPSGFRVEGGRDRK